MTFYICLNVSSLRSVNQDGKRLILETAATRGLCNSRRSPGYAYGRSAGTMSALCGAQNQLFFHAGRACWPPPVRASLSRPPLRKHYLLWPVRDQVLIWGFFSMLFLCGISPTCPWRPLGASTFLDQPPMRCQWHPLCGRPSPEPRVPQGQSLMGLGCLRDSLGGPEILAVLCDPLPSWLS